MRCCCRMLSHVISIPFTALHSTHAALELKPPQSPLLLCRRNILFLVNSYPLKCRKCPFSCTVSCSWFFTNREKLHFKRFLLVLLIVPVSYFQSKINGVQVIKSGTDFRELSCITVSFNDDNTFGLDVQRIEITSDIQEDPEVKLTVDKFVGELEMIFWLLHCCMLSFCFFALD